MPHKILLVDDEKDIVEFLQYNLEQEGFNVISAYDGEEALERISENPDLILLDIMMPRLDGFEVCKKIRSIEKFENTPIIFLTAKTSEIDEIRGLDFGADDYVKKPISPKKLIARVKSNIRKLGEFKHDKKVSPVIKVGPLTIDRERFKAKINDSEIILPKKEFEVLSFLASDPGKVFSRESILRNVWGSDIYVVDRTIDVHIRKIREKLLEHSELIETVKGVGYQFKSAD